MMTWHEIAARLVFAAGLGLIWYVMGPVGLSGAGLFLLVVLAAQQILANGRLKQTEREHSQTSPWQSRRPD